ncbi:GMP synthase-like glutamine amidotransferase [Alkalispirillum mobile]|uniref:GMP synthase-like glutamine amidotransferase n=1 Tax=Alkalispirillum mobile TaxID=85925 RepID=A0A498CDW6_9GAMM|nr:GMP synthase-like glutamine amidotransferase [Alkalispirillum mobile]
METTVRAHYLQHVPFEGLGSIGPWLQAAGYEITATRFFESAVLPAPQDIDLLIIMGGPMSVNDEGQHPWLVPEKRFIRQCIEHGVPVLGVCLGAQMIASALGARVRAMPHKEIGWFPVHSIQSVDEGHFSVPDGLEVFHWHGEAFDLPAGAVHLARSAACENQAFQVGDRVVGLQFHLESTPESVREIVEHCRAELLPAPHVQPEAPVLEGAATRCGPINAVMADVLGTLTGRI